MIPSAETCAAYFSCEVAFVSILSVYVKVDGWDRLADDINERMQHLAPVWSLRYVPGAWGAPCTGAMKGLSS